MGVAQFLFRASEFLSYLMLFVLAAALTLRYIAFRTGTRDEIYFKTFSKSVEKLLDNEGRHEKIADVEDWLASLMNRVTEHLPNRTLRFSGLYASGARSAGRGRPDDNRETFAEFAHGRRSIAHSIRHQVDAFKSPQQPNFSDLTERVLGQDRLWRNMLGVVPVEMVSRMLDILPGLFVIAGILGTFVGVTSGLPKIAAIDLTQIETIGPILNSFVKDIAFSMNTSIVGIICSLVMTVLNAIYPVTELRMAVAKNMEGCLELIWYRIHGEKFSAADARIIELLEVLCGMRAGDAIPSGRSAGNPAQGAA